MCPPEGSRYQLERQDCCLLECAWSREPPGQASAAHTPSTRSRCTSPALSSAPAAFPGSLRAAGSRAPSPVPHWTDLLFSFPLLLSRSSPKSPDTATLSALGLALVRGALLHSLNWTQSCVTRRPSRGAMEAAVTIHLSACSDISWTVRGGGTSPDVTAPTPGKLSLGPLSKVWDDLNSLGNQWATLHPEASIPVQVLPLPSPLLPSSFPRCWLGHL